MHLSPPGLKRARLRSARLLSALIVAVTGTGSPAASSQDLMEVDVNLRMVSVTARNADGGFVDVLRADDFTVTEAGETQDIRYFDPPTAPLSLVVLLDMSTSMMRSWEGDHLDEVGRGLDRVLGEQGPVDELLLLSFNSRNSITQRLDLDQIPVSELLEEGIYANREVASGPGRRFYDALSSALDILAQRPMNRRAILLVSDGFDNPDVTEAPPVRRLLQSGASFHAITFPHPGFSPRLANLEILATTTGGRSEYLGDESAEFEPALSQVVDTIRHSYRLGYYSQAEEPPSIAVQGDGYTLMLSAEPPPDLLR